MTIAQRIDDAEFLWTHGRQEGALLTVLVAFASTARRIRPKSQVSSDKEAFKEFFREELPSGFSVGFRGQLTSMEELFYVWLRCELLHEGGLPMGLTFDVDDNNGLFALTLTDDLPLAISSVWYHSLILAVVGHPVNADIFPTQQELVLRRLKAHEAVGQRVVGKRIAHLVAPTTKPSTSSDSGVVNLSKEPPELHPRRLHSLRDVAAAHDFADVRMIEQDGGR
jgi:hypothetical protein